MRARGIWGHGEARATRAIWAAGRRTHTHTHTPLLPYQTKCQKGGLNPSPQRPGVSASHPSREGIFPQTTRTHTANNPPKLLAFQGPQGAVCPAFCCGRPRSCSLPLPGARADVLPAEPGCSSRMAGGGWRTGWGLVAFLGQQEAERCPSSPLQTAKGQWH